MLRSEELADLQQAIRYHRNEGNYSEVIRLAEELLEKGVLHSHADAILTGHFTCALAYYYIGNYERVLYHIEAHHENCLSFGRKKDWMRSYYLQYFLTLFTRNYKKAQVLMEDVMSIANEIGNYAYVSIAATNLAHVFNQQKQFSGALKAAQYAVKHANLHAPERPILYVRASLNLIEAAIGLERYDLAETSIRCIKRMDVLSSNKRENAYLAVLEGRLHEKYGKLEKAYEYFTAAYETDGSFHDYNLRKEIQQKRIAMAEALATPDELYLLQKEYIDLLHDLENQNWMRVALDVEIRLRTSSDELQMHIDFLTGVYNRKYLEETTNRWLAEAKETREEIVCIAFDIDNLKEINDTYGHLAGDEAIKLVAETCSGVIRKGDLLGRFGGDEFVLVMRGISLENAKAKAVQISNQIEQVVVKVNDSTIPITLSIGLGDSLTRDIRTFKDLFHLADLALYRAKKNGKNQIVTFA